MTDTMIAFGLTAAAAARGEEQKVFDWHKAARLIRERKPTVARAGLRDDWEYTGGTIFTNGKPVPKEETYTYLSSNWALPELSLDGEILECLMPRKDSPGWDAHTYWPESALAILRGDEVAS